MATAPDDQEIITKINTVFQLYDRKRDGTCDERDVATLIRWGAPKTFALRMTVICVSRWELPHECRLHIAEWNVPCHCHCRALGLNPTHENADRLVEEMVRQVPAI